MLGAPRTPRFEDWGLRAVPGKVGGELPRRLRSDQGLLEFRYT